VKNHGKDSWKELYKLTSDEIYKGSGYADNLRQ